MLLYCFESLSVEECSERVLIRRCTHKTQKQGSEEVWREGWVGGCICSSPRLVCACGAVILSASTNPNPSPLFPSLPASHPVPAPPPPPAPQTRTHCTHSTRLSARPCLLPRPSSILGRELLHGRHDDVVRKVHALLLLQLEHQLSSRRVDEQPALELVVARVVALPGEGRGWGGRWG